ncbi:C-type lectin BpLec-like [Tiliqua scincoides]|uniref:C-type lectin BpLec-like n=1 Tax=Tiliqua scincoides TaxID=71010 RepID=UPI003462B3F4
MSLLTSSALLGILICSSFLGAKASACDRDWMQNQGNCYAFFEEKVTWAEAETECQSYGRGAHLASILTEAETYLVFRYIANYPNVQSHVWIGLRDFRKNLKWKWADGSALNYKAWAVSQPDNYQQSEYCGQLTLGSGFKEWNDAPCMELNAYICKYEM